MKRKAVTKEVHVTEPCDEWLSTRNKNKVKPPSPKHIRRRSSVVKGFPRPSSSVYHLTQSAPPHPLLFTATKQSTIQGFFKPVNSKSPTPVTEEICGSTADDDVVELDDEEEELEPESSEIIPESECEHIRDSFEIGSEFNPILASTQYTSIQTSDSSKLTKKTCKDQHEPHHGPRERTLSAFSDRDVHTCGQYSCDIDSVQTEDSELLLWHQNSLSKTEKVNPETDLSNFGDSDSDKLCNVNEKSFSSYKKTGFDTQVMQDNDFSSDHADSLTFSDNLQSCNDLIQETANKCGKNINHLNSNSSEYSDSEMLIAANSLTFTQTERDNCKETIKSRSEIPESDSLDGKISQTFGEIMESIRTKRVKKKGAIYHHARQTFADELTRKTNMNQGYVNTSTKMPALKHNENKCRWNRNDKIHEISNTEMSFSADNKFQNEAHHDERIVEKGEKSDSDQEGFRHFKRNANASLHKRKAISKDENICTSSGSANELNYESVSEDEKLISKHSLHKPSRPTKFENERNENSGNTRLSTGRKYSFKESQRRTDEGKVVETKYEEDTSSNFEQPAKRPRHTLLPELSDQCWRPVNHKASKPRDGNNTFDLSSSQTSPEGKDTQSSRHGDKSYLMAHCEKSENMRHRQDKSSKAKSQSSGGKHENVYRAYEKSECFESVKNDSLIDSQSLDEPCEVFQAAGRGRYSKLKNQDFEIDDVDSFVDSLCFDDTTARGSIKVDSITDSVIDNSLTFTEI